MRVNVAVIKCLKDSGTGIHSDLYRYHIWMSVVEEVGEGEGVKDLPSLARKSNWS